MNRNRKIHKETKTQRNERLYNKEMSRIKRFVKNAEKRGYQFDLSFLPDKPQNIKITSVRKLQKIKPADFYKHGVYGGPESFGEIIPAEEGRKLERKASAKKSQQTRKKNRENRNNKNQNNNTNRDNYSHNDDFFTNVVISNWYGELETFANGSAYNLLRAWMGSMIRENGRENVAQMLQEGAEAGVRLTWETVYKSGYAKTYMGDLLDHMPDQGVLYKEQVMDRVQFMEALGDALEQSEDWEYPQ